MIALVLDQHAVVHTAAISSSGGWSFEDEVWQDISDEQARHIPAGCDHSLAWVTWHMARIEDVTMNILVAGSPQAFVLGNWQHRLQISRPDTGNLMDRDAVAQLSADVDIAALRAYRMAVGRRTREIIQPLSPTDLNQKMQPDRLRQLRDQGAVIEAAGDLIDYWSKRTVAGLLMMPATRHNFVHLNEAQRIKQKLR